MLRKLGGGIAKLAENVKASHIMIRLPVLEKIDSVQMAECITEGVALGDYRFLKYKKPDPEEKTYSGLREVILSSDSSDVIGPPRYGHGGKRGQGYLSCQGYGQ